MPPTKDEEDIPTGEYIADQLGLKRIDVDDPFRMVKVLIEKLADIPQSISGFTLVRPSDCTVAIEALEKVLYKNSILLRRRNETFTREFFECIDRLEKLPQIRAYPNELLRLTIVKGRALLEHDDPERALNVIRHIGDRPYLVEGDAANVQALLRLKQDALLLLGGNDEAARVAQFGFRLVLRRASRRAPSAFHQFSPGLHLNSVKTQSFESTWIGTLARWRVEMGRERGSRAVRKLQRGIRKLFDYAAGLATWFIFAMLRRIRRLFPQTTHDTGTSNGVVVTRAMGGVGDLIMMTPGLRALAKREGKPIHLAIKEDFFPLFYDNPDVVLHNINGEKVDVESFSRWYDLSFCPAARYESRHLPRVKKGRVELFAAGMGITAPQLEASGIQPTLNLRPDCVKRAASFFTEHHLDGTGPVVAVQAFSRDTYKDYPRMQTLIGMLSEKYKVIVFHHVSFPLPEHPNIIRAFGLSLADAIATFARCQLAICADSAFLHVAAALQIPTIALFGPTDEKLFTAHHPKAHVVSMKETFKCMPCWRNEDIPCLLNGGRESVCMASLHEDRIVTLAEQILRENEPSS